MLIFCSLVTCFLFLVLLINFHLNLYFLSSKPFYVLNSANLGLDLCRKSLFFMISRCKSPKGNFKFSASGQTSFKCWWGVGGFRVLISVLYKIYSNAISNNWCLNLVELMFCSVPSRALMKPMLWRSEKEKEKEKWCVNVCVVEHGGRRSESLRVESNSGPASDSDATFAHSSGCHQRSSSACHRPANHRASPLWRSHTARIQPSSPTHLSLSWRHSTGPIYATACP